MPWLAVNVEIDAALAEPLGDALLEEGAQSVAIDRPDTPRPTVSALLALQVDVAAMLARAARQCDLPEVPAFAVAQIEDQDWVRRTQAQFSPVSIGRRLWIGASWHPAPPARLVVRLDPGLAFGTGSHPTTRLVLRFLESGLRAGESVLDYGCGSGILAIAAAKLGAAPVDATDVDPQAIATAKENAAANGVEVRTMLPEALPAGSYDVVVSNILAQPLIVLAPLLAARARRAGRIALAGVLESQAGEVAEAYGPWFDMKKITEAEEGWALVSGVRR